MPAKLQAAYVAAWHGVVKPLSGACIGTGTGCTEYKHMLTLHLNKKQLQVPMTVRHVTTWGCSTCLGGLQCTLHNDWIVCRHIHVQRQTLVALLKVDHVTAARPLVRTTRPAATAAVNLLHSGACNGLCYCARGGRRIPRVAERRLVAHSHTKAVQLLTCQHPTGFTAPPRHRIRCNRRLPLSCLEPTAPCHHTPGPQPAAAITALPSSSSSSHARRRSRCGPHFGG